MKDSDRIIVVIYIDVSNINRSDVLEYVEHVRNAVVFDDSVKTLYIPVEETTHIEVLNPRYVPKSEYRKIVKHYNEALNNIKKTLGIENDITKKGEDPKIDDCGNYFLVGGLNRLKVHWNFKLLPKGFEAITLFGHIFDHRKKEDLRTFLETYAGEVMVNHERIHTLQGESFKFKYFTFYLLYIWYWFIGLFKYGVKNHASYHHIPFEIEAYANDEDFTYSRSEWKKYIKK